MAAEWRNQYLRYKEFFLNITTLYKKRVDLRMFLEIILSLTTVIIFSVFALKPTALTIINLVKEIKEKEKTISTLNQKIGNLETARENYNQIETSIPKIISSIPDGPQPDNLIKQIEKMASKNSVGILGISIGEAPILNKDDMKRDKLTVDISVNLTGPYLSLVSFIKDLENFRRPIKLDNLVINSLKTEDANTLVATITGKMPYEK